MLIKIKQIISNCIDTCIETSREYGKSNDLVLGANIAAF
jgi:hypothetical protein